MKTAMYIQGAKDRALKNQPSVLGDQDYYEGYEYMQSLLGPIEQEIVLATLKYQSVAQKTIRELEDQFCDRGDAGNAATIAAEPAYPSE